MKSVKWIQNFPRADGTERERIKSLACGVSAFGASNNDLLVLSYALAHLFVITGRYVLGQQDSVACRRTVAYM